MDRSSRNSSPETRETDERQAISLNHPLIIATRGKRHRFVRHSSRREKREVEEPKADVGLKSTAVHDSHLGQQILLASGRIHKKKVYCGPTVSHMLQKREVGMGGKQCFSNGDRCAIGTLYIPNMMSTVAYCKDKAFCGIYSKEGDIFLSAGRDIYIRLYDTSCDEFRHIKSIRAQGFFWSILDAAFSPDGKYVIYSSWSDCIHLCNIQGDRDIHEALPLFPGRSTFCIFSLTFSSDNKEILGGANCGNFYVYDLEKNEKTLTIKAHSDDVNAVKFADDSSQILFTGGDDGFCKVWDRRTLNESNPSPVGIFSGHSGGITYIDSRGDSRYLISNSKDQTIKLWDLRKFSMEEGIKATEAAISFQRWDYRWRPISQEMKSRKPLPGDVSVMTYRGHTVLHTLIRCKFSPRVTTGQRYIYSGCATGNACIYDVLTGEIVTKLSNCHSTCVRDVSWHPTKNTIVTTSWDSTICQWYYYGIEQHRDFENGELYYLKSFRRLFD
ncbi:DDB1- and CUL4-associated factor 11-like isoform X1 [Argonauta hians]